VFGETGVGKELAARALHAGSRRRDAPFIQVNCAALPEGVIESELFGHVRGAFTGAVAHRTGKFEITAALDEAGGNWAEAARRLGMNRSNLHHMAQRLRAPR
jgi:transcriptional regulator with GAF, ATPase, and Fis domain